MVFGITKGTILRTSVLVLAIINTSFQLFGFEVLPFAEDEIETFVSVVLNAVAAISVWWKNNSFTKEAKQADAHLNALQLKKGR